MDICQFLNEFHAFWWNSLVPDTASSINRRGPWFLGISILYFFSAVLSRFWGENQGANFVRLGIS